MPSTFQVNKPKAKAGSVSKAVPGWHENSPVPSTFQVNKPKAKAGSVSKAVPGWQGSARLVGKKPTPPLEPLPPESPCPFQAQQAAGEEQAEDPAGT